MYKNLTVAVIIPAFNERPSIEVVINEIKALQSKDGITIVDDIVVCDNASTDDTGKIAHAAGARVIREEQRGYGNACLAAIGALGDPDVVVFVDADHSVVAAELPVLLDDIAAGSDLVIGSRVADKQENNALTLPQKVGNLLASRLIQLLWRQPVTDLGPFRAIRYPQLLSLNMQDQCFGWTVEMQVKAIQTGMRVSEVPVSTLKRIGRSKISGTVSGVIGAATGIFGMIFKLWLQQRSDRTEK